MIYAGNGSPRVVCVRLMSAICLRLACDSISPLLLIPTSCTLWPPTHLWSTVKRACSLLLLSFASLHFSLQIWAWSHWQCVWGSSLFKPLEERRAICNSFKPEHLPERPSASQCMQFVNLIRLQKVTESGEIKLSIWQKRNRVIKLSHLYMLKSAYWSDIYLWWDN